MIAQQDAQLMLDTLRDIRQFCSIFPKPSKEIDSIKLRCQLVLDQIEKAPHKS